MLRRILEEVLRLGENALQVTRGAEMVCFALLGLLAAGFLLSFVRLLPKKRPAQAQDLAFAMDKNRGVVAGFCTYAKVVIVLLAAVAILDYTGAKTVFFSPAAALVFTGAGLVAVLVFEGTLLLFCCLKNKNLRFLYKVARAGEERRLQSLRSALKTAALSRGETGAGCGARNDVPDRVREEGRGTCAGEGRAAVCGAYNKEGQGAAFGGAYGDRLPEKSAFENAASVSMTGAREIPVDPLSVVARYWSCDGGDPVKAQGYLTAARQGAGQGACIGQTALTPQAGQTVRQTQPDLRQTERKNACYTAEPKVARYAAEAVAQDPIKSPVPGVPAPGITKPGMPGVPPADVPAQGEPGDIPTRAPAQPVTEPGVAPSPVVEPKTGAEIVGKNSQAAEKPAGINAAIEADIPSPVFYGAAISKEKVEELLRRAGNLPLSETDAFHVKKIELSLRDAMSSGCPADAMSTLLSALVKVIARYEAA